MQLAVNAAAGEVRTGAVRGPANIAVAAQLTPSMPGPLTSVAAPVKPVPPSPTWLSTPVVPLAK